MNVLPLKSVREEDKHILSNSLFLLAKLSHLGFSVVSGFIVLAPNEEIASVVSKYQRVGLLRDNLLKIKDEVLRIEVPQEVLDLQQAHADSIWKSLLEKWFAELQSKIHREDFKMNLTPQFLVFSSKFEASGMGYYDAEKKHVVINFESGESEFNLSQKIEEMIVSANRKLLIPQNYYFVVEEGVLKIIKITPYTNIHNSQTEDFNLSSTDRSDLSQPVTLSKTALKFFVEPITKSLEFSKEIDGVYINVSDGWNLENLKLENLEVPVLFSLAEKTEQMSLAEKAEEFLFLRHKKSFNNLEIVLPKTHSVEEFLQVKRDLAAEGVYSKGSLKMWIEIYSPSNFINIEQYLDAGFDGAIINLDELLSNILGEDVKKLDMHQMSRFIDLLITFLENNNFKKLRRANIPILISGKMALVEEILGFFILNSVTGIVLKNNNYQGMKEHVGFLEKKLLKIN